MTIIGWVALAVYAAIAAGMYIPNRNVTGDRGVGLIIPFMLGAAVVVASIILGFAQYLGSATAVNIIAWLVATPLVVVLPVTAISVLSSFAESRAERLVGSFSDPTMSQMGAAIHENEPDRLEALLAGKPRIDWAARDGNGVTLFGIALMQARRLDLYSVKGMECLRLLVDAGARFQDDAMGPDTHVMPDIVTGFGLDLLELVLKAGGNANSKDTLGNPALIGDFINFPKAKLLVEAGAEVRSLRMKDERHKDYDALMYATMSARWDLALLYLEHGCDPDYQAPDGKSAKSIAEEHAENKDDSDGNKNRNGFLKALAAAKGKK